MDCDPLDNNPQKPDEISDMRIIPHLHTLVLNFSLGSWQPGDGDVADIFAEMKNLNRIDLAITGDRDHFWYQRWDRGASGSMIVEPQVALHWKEWSLWNWTSEQWS
jgi:hypothetical protein